MAISIKSLDTRVTALENKLSGSVIGFPDWTKMKIVKAQNSGNNFDYVAKTQIWIAVWLSYPNRSSITINGNQIGRVASDSGRWEDHNTIIIPLNTSDKVSVTSCYYGVIYEIPIKLYYNFIEKIGGVVKWLYL